MANELDEFGFEPIDEELSEEGLDEFGFEALEEAPIEEEGSFPTSEESRLSDAGQGVEELIEALPAEVKGPIGGAVAGQAVKSGVEALPSEAMKGIAEDLAYSASGGTSTPTGRKFLRDQLQQLGDLPEGGISTRSIGRRALDEGLVDVFQGAGTSYDKAEKGLLDSIKQKTDYLQSLKKPVDAGKVSRSMRKELLPKVDLALGGADEDRLLRGLAEEDVRMSGKFRTPSELERAKVKTQEAVVYRPGIEPLGRSEEKLKRAKAKALREAVEEAVGKEGGEEALQKFLKNKKATGERGILRNLMLEKDYRSSVSPTIGLRDIATTGVGGPGMTVADKAIRKKGAAVGAKAFDTIGDIADKLKRSGIIRSLPVVGAGIGLAASFGEARAEGLGTLDAAGRAIEQEGMESVMGGLAPERIAEDKREELMMKRAKGEQLTPEERDMLKPFRQEKPPVLKAKDQVTQLTDEQFGNFANRLVESPNKGLNLVGARLMEVGNQEGPAKEQLLWSLSQSPAMRELIRRERDDNASQERSEYVTQPETLGESPMASEGESELQREPAGESELLGKIAAGEGTSDERAAKEGYDSGYDVTLGYGKFDPEGYDKPVSQMTLDELDEFQQGMLSNPDNPFNSSAVGKYQIVSKTLRGLRDNLGLSGDEIFTPELQDTMARELLKGRGYDKFKSGELSMEDFQKNLSQEWASVQNPETGESYYGGQGAPTSAQDIAEALSDLSSPSEEAENGGLDLDALLRDYAAREPEAEQEVEWQAPEELQSLEQDIDRVNKQQGSGDNTPVDQLEGVLEKLNRLRLPQQEVDQLERDAIAMDGFNQGAELKEKLRRLMGG